MDEHKTFNIRLIDTHLYKKLDQAYRGTTTSALLECKALIIIRTLIMVDQCHDFLENANRNNWKDSKLKDAFNIIKQKWSYDCVYVLDSVGSRGFFKEKLEGENLKTRIDSQLIFNNVSSTDKIKRNIVENLLYKEMNITDINIFEHVKEFSCSSLNKFLIPMMAYPNEVPPIENGIILGLDATKENLNYSSVLNNMCDIISKNRDTSRFYISGGLPTEYDAAGKSGVQTIAETFLQTLSPGSNWTTPFSKYKSMRFKLIAFEPLPGYPTSLPSMEIMDFTYYKGENNIINLEIDRFFSEKFLFTPGLNIGKMRPQGKNLVYKKRQQLSGAVGQVYSENIDTVIVEDLTPLQTVGEIKLNRKITQGAPPLVVGVIDTEDNVYGIVPVDSLAFTDKKNWTNTVAAAKTANTAKTPPAKKPKANEPSSSTSPTGDTTPPSAVQTIKTINNKNNSVNFLTLNFNPKDNIFLYKTLGDLGQALNFYAITNPQRIPGAEAPPPTTNFYVTFDYLSGLLSSVFNKDTVLEDLKNKVSGLRIFSLSTEEVISSRDLLKAQDVGELAVVTILAAQARARAAERQALEGARTLQSIAGFQSFGRSTKNKKSIKNLSNEEIKKKLKLVGIKVTKKIKGKRKQLTRKELEKKALDFKKLQQKCKKNKIKITYINKKKQRVYKTKKRLLSDLKKTKKLNKKK